MMRLRRVLLGFTITVTAGLIGCERPAESSASERSAETDPLKAISCRAELRSFIVLGKGRHLYLVIDCPDGYDRFDGRVEYTTASMRSDYIAPNDRSGAARVAKMSAGRPLLPIIENADDRLEAKFEITLDQAICLQQDRVFSAEYALLGTNSSSGLRFAMEECGCEMPSRVVNSGGMFGEFPGIKQDPGRVIDRVLWPSFGIEGEVPIMRPDDVFGPADPVG